LPRSNDWSRPRGKGRCRPGFRAPRPAGYLRNAVATASRLGFLLTSTGQGFGGDILSVMRTVLCLSFFLTALLVAPPAAGANANVTRVELHQRQEVLLKHERFVGNLRAQAKREGIIQHVPQL